MERPKRHRSHRHCHCHRHRCWCCWESINDNRHSSSSNNNSGKHNPNKNPNNNPNSNSINDDNNIFIFNPSTRCSPSSSGRRRSVRCSMARPAAWSRTGRRGAARGPDEGAAGVVGALCLAVGAETGTGEAEAARA